VYPAFGSPGSVRTHPPVKVQKSTECLLPNAFCSFEFALTRAQLEETLENEPLILEVVHCDTYQSDSEVGIVKIVLSHLLTAPAHKSEENEAPCTLQVIDAYYNVYDLTTEKKIRAVGTLRVVTMLEDFGPVVGLPSSGGMGGGQLGGGNPVTTASSSDPTVSSSSRQQQTSSSSSSSQLVHPIRATVQHNSHNTHINSSHPRPQQQQQQRQQRTTDPTQEEDLRAQFGEWKDTWVRREEAKFEERWKIEESRRMQVCMCVCV
jgi:hypothetical protein